MDNLSRFVSIQTTVSVLFALLLWDGILFWSLGTSPVLGALRGELPSLDQSST